MKWKTRILAASALALALASCGLTDPFGSAVRRDGTHIEGTGRIDK